MQEPVWGDERLARAICGRQASEHGGAGKVRDELLLAMALERPQGFYAYDGESAELAKLAAAYLVGIVGNPPFVDGNARCAAAICETFLNLNEVELATTDVEFYDLVLAVEAGEIKKGDVTEWFKRKTPAA